jgi:hypothetical protein
MGRPTKSAPVLAALASMLVLAGCTKPESILLVEIAGPLDISPAQLRVTVTAGIDARAILVPAEPLTPGNTMMLPTSFSIGIDRAHTAPITISIDALDSDRSPIAFGTSMQDHIAIGGQTVITVFLMAGSGPDEGTAGAGGGAGAGGAGGDGGDSGAAGQDGGDAAAGADGGGDGMGLDGATD